MDDSLDMLFRAKEAWKIIAQAMVDPLRISFRDEMQHMIDEAVRAEREACVAVIKEYEQIFDHEASTTHNERVCDEMRICQMYAQKMIVAIRSREQEGC